jgi:hypothetical protein
MNDTRRRIGSRTHAADRRAKAANLHRRLRATGLTTNEEHYDLAARVTGREEAAYTLAVLTDEEMEAVERSAQLGADMAGRTGGLFVRDVWAYRGLDLIVFDSLTPGWCKAVVCRAGEHVGLAVFSSSVPADMDAREVWDMLEQAADEYVAACLRANEARREGQTLRGEVPAC